MDNSVRVNWADLIQVEYELKIRDNMTNPRQNVRNVFGLNNKSVSPLKGNQTTDQTIIGVIYQKTIGLRNSVWL